MKVAEFYLINEKNEQFSLMDIKNYCMLTNPSGLGYSYSSSYEQIGNTFIAVLRKLEQGLIEGIAKFRNYDNFRNFVNFIENAESVKFLYKIPFKSEKMEFYKDVLVKNISKTTIMNEDEEMQENIVFDCLSLWYQNEETTYTVGDQDMMWDFMWDARFADYKSRSIVFENDGHVDAPMQIEIADYTKNPTIYVMHKNKEVFNLSLPIIIQNGEKLLYSSKEKEIYIKKQNRDGTYENLFKYPYIDLNNRNIFRLPKGTCEITLTAENNIVNSKLNIFKQYKVV